jgi:TolB-like protein
MMLLPAPAAAAAKTVAIVPFRVNAEKDMNYLRDGVYDMLASRLYKEGEVEVLNRQVVERALPAGSGPLAETAARELGRKLGADFILFGSLTVLGNSISLDSKMVDVGGAKPTLSFFEQSEDAGGIITRLNQMSADINAKMFGRAQAAARPVAAPAPAPMAGAEAGQSQAHPEKMFKQRGGMGAEGMDSPFVSEDAGREISPQFWKSAGFKQLFNGIALGDVDGDGRTETVILTPHSLLIYRYDQQRFAQVFELADGGRQYHIGVDVADINGNGIPEIFVTSMGLMKKSLNSFVLEFDGKGYRKIAENLPWYFRVNEPRTQGKVLIGQEHRAGSPYGGRIYEMVWRNNQYEPETPMQLAGGVNVLGVNLTDVLDGGREAPVAFDSEDHLRVYDEAGKQLWKSAERYGGSTLYFSGDITDYGDIEKPIYFPMRTVPLRSAKDGKTRLIAVKNHDVAGSKLEKFRSFKESQIISFAWDGLGLAPEWKTRKISGYIRDFAIGDFNNDGTLELVAAVVLDEGAVITTSPKSTVIALEFK